MHERLQLLDELDSLLAASERARVLLVGRVVDCGPSRVVTRQVRADRRGEDGGLAPTAGSALDVERLGGAGALAPRCSDWRDPRERLPERNEYAGQELELAIESVANFAY